MKPISKPTPQAIPLQQADDAMLEKMKQRVARIFSMADASYQYDAMSAQASAAAAFAAICAEQRERAMLRAATTPASARSKSKARSPQ